MAVVAVPMNRLIYPSQRWKIRRRTGTEMNQIDDLVLDLFGNLRGEVHWDIRHRSSQSLVHISHKFVHEYPSTGPKNHFPNFGAELGVTCVMCG